MDPNQNGGRRLDAYVRVSSLKGREGDSFISTDVQEERIRHWAAAHGYTISDDGPDGGAWHELDVSGGSMNRPKLNEIMARIDAGESDGVVVYNLSRFARTLVGSIELIHRINERGALFASVSDGFDITTITGRMVLGILLSIAQAERERLGESWQTAKTKAVARRIHISAHAPFGYLRPRQPANARTGKASTMPLEPDPVTAWMVPELFRRRAAGEPWEKLRQFLVDNQAPTVRGADWSASTVLTIVRNRVYLGEARGAGGPPLKNAHPALVDEATWQAAQQRGRRYTVTDSGALLRGLVRCGSCRYTMQQRSLASRNGAVDYACAGRVGCPHPALIVGTGINGKLGVDEIVVSLVREWELQRGEAIEFDGYDPTVDVAADQAELEQMIADRELDALDDELQEALGRPAWKKQLAEKTARIIAKQTEIEEKLRLLGGPGGRPRAELWDKWDSGEMTLEEKRDHLASVIQAVFIKPASRSDRGLGTLKDLDLRRSRLRERVHIVWMVDGPLTDIPRQGHGGYKVKPWPFPVRPDPDELGVVALQPDVEGAGEPVG